MTMEKHHTALCSEFMVMALLSKQGHDIFPAAAASRADFIRVCAEGTFKCQVKTATRTQSGPYTYEQARLCKRNEYVTKNGDRWIPKHYTEEEIDEIWVVGTHIWRFPMKTVLGLNSLALLSNGPNPREKSYSPEKHIIVRGAWENPLRDVFSLDTGVKL